MFIVCVILLIFLGIPGGMLVLSLLQISLSATIKYMSFQNGEAVYYTKITNETSAHGRKYICLFLVYIIHVE